MSAPENPPAFPQTKSVGQISMTEGGMSLRDYFAGQALIGAALEVADNGHEVASLAKGMAVSAYQIADAMLIAREQK